MSEQTVKKDKVVTLTYTLKDENGDIFEYRDLPVSYLHGHHSDIFPQIEAGLYGRKVGDTVTIRLSPDDAFGQHDESLTFTDDIDNVPPQFRKLGAEVEATNDKGETRSFYVTRIDDKTLTVDGNHPLAGQHVQFIVTVKDIRDATAEELRSGMPAGGGVGLA